jgi:hypothetical protein
VVERLHEFRRGEDPVADLVASMEKEAVDQGTHDLARIKPFRSSCGDKPFDCRSVKGVKAVSLSAGAERVMARLSV